jgi:O-antigen/teichoic acid export membrane protein
MARGALWLMLLTFVDRISGLLSTLILARVLMPADFGIVAMAFSFIFLAQLLSAFGFDVALIHKQDASEAHYHSAWTLNFLLGACITLVAFAAASPVASFYKQPDVFWVVCALGLGPLLGGCENIGVVAFRKDLDFRKEFMFQISRRIVSFAVTIPLAFWLRSYWALVAGTLAMRLAGTVTSYLVHPFRPHFSLVQAPSLLQFSKWLLLNNVLGLLKERMSDFVIGRIAGAGALGIYNITYEFSNLPTTEIGAPINRALLPGFAKLTDATIVRSTYMSAMGMLALVAIPTAAGILAVAHFFVPVVLGQKWLAGIPLMEILSVSSAFLMFQASICSVLIGRGYPRTVMHTNAVFVAILALLLLVLAPAYGARGAALAALSTTALSTPLYLYQLRRHVGVPMRAFLAVIVRPTIAAALMVIVVRIVLPDYSTNMTTPQATFWLLLGIGTGAATYAVFSLLMWLAVGRPNGPERVVLENLQARFARLWVNRRSIAR